MPDTGRPEALPGDRRFRRGLWIRPAAVESLIVPTQRGSSGGVANGASQAGAEARGREREYDTGQYDREQVRWQGDTDEVMDGGGVHSLLMSGEPSASPAVTRGAEAPPAASSGASLDMADRIRGTVGVSDEERTAFDLGESWLRKGRLKKAIPYFERIDRGPLGGAAAAYLGAIHAEAGRFKEAEQWFRRALSGQDSFAQRGYGILLDITTYLGAGDKYTRWAADGKDGAAANHLGGSLVLRGFAGDGEAVLRRAATEYGHPPAMFRLALLLAAGGGRAEAARWCDRAREAGDQVANCSLSAFRVHAGELTAEEAQAVKRPRATDGYEPLVRALEQRWGVRASRNADRQLKLAARENLDGMLALKLLGLG